MYKLNVRSHFSAAHKLNRYDGACKRLHGHNWKVRVCLACEKRDATGMCIDFGDIKRYLKDVLDRFDHQYLNELKIFKDENPTSENIAKLIFQELKSKITNNNCKVSEVEIWESEKSSVIYSE